MDPFERLEEAEERLRVALSGVRSHFRRYKSGRVSHVNNYYRLSDGKKLDLGDITIDSYGRKRTVVSIVDGKIIFNDFSVGSKDDFFRIVGNALREKSKGIHKPSND
jgi:hypothetical protein